MLDRPSSWPRRIPRQMHVPKTSLWDNLDVSAQRYPEHPATIFFGAKLSYRDLHQQAQRLSATLHTLGVRRGDRVLVLMQNCPQAVAAHFGVMRANAVVVPANPMSRAQELRHLLADSGARMVITTGDLLQALAEANQMLDPADRLRCVIATRFTDAFDPDHPDAGPMPAAWRDWLLQPMPRPVIAGAMIMDWKTALSPVHAPPSLQVGPEDMALLPYTSGTTGQPKGCIHTHSSLVHNAMASATWGQATNARVALAVVPFFHITGIVSVMHAAVYCGGTMVIMPRWDREVAGHCIERWQVTTWTNIPTMLMDLMASPKPPSLASLADIGGGGTAMPAPLARQIRDRYGLVYAEGYGLTETAGPCHSNPAEAAREQCLGLPFIGCDARIIDADGLSELGPGETGEIVVRGPMLFQGYWRQPEATREAFVELGGRKFFRTGDIGHRDESGYFYITDRLKRMINASGFKVWPAEVEANLFRHPAVQEACVVSAPDGYRGETVKALVVLRGGHDVSPEEIVAWCRDHMAVYKAPKSVQLVQSLPKGATGKVQWRELQALQWREALAAA
jgi:fatty-acyl-CoA synthase